MEDVRVLTLLGNLAVQFGVELNRAENPESVQSPRYFSWKSSIFRDWQPRPFAEMLAK
jgi:hypothetical protein